MKYTEQKGGLFITHIIIQQMEEILNSGKKYEISRDGRGEKSIVRCELTNFGKKIRKGLFEKEMTQRELAKLVGCSPQYMRKILVGERSGEKYSDKIKNVLNIE